MNNLLPSSIKLHEKYDLKGSTYKRKASKQERAKTCPTLKDLDYRELHTDGIMLEAETFTALLKTMDRDCRVSILVFIVYCVCNFPSVLYLVVYVTGLILAYLLMTSGYHTELFVPPSFCRNILCPY